MISDLLFLGIVAAAHHRQCLSGGHLPGHEHPALRPILHRTKVDGDLVAGLERGSGPAAAGEKIRAHALEAVSVRAAFVVRNVDPKPDVRIRPIDLLDGAGDGLLRGDIEGGKRMMCGSRKDNARDQARCKCNRYE